MKGFLARLFGKKEKDEQEEEHQDSNEQEEGLPMPQPLAPSPPPAPAPEISLPKQETQAAPPAGMWRCSKCNRTMDDSTGICSFCGAGKGA